MSLATQRDITDDRLIRLAVRILDSARGPVKDPECYIVGAVRDS
jgi:hypothetical protein